MQAPPSRILRSRWEGFACCLIIRNIMKKSINEISDEEFVQQLIVKLDNLLAEADSVYNSPPPLPGKEERCYESYISWAENFIDDYGGIMACEAPQDRKSVV